MNLVSSDTTTYFQFSPLCSDGSAAGSDFCSQSAPPAISQFTIRVNVVNGSSSETAVGCTSRSPAAPNAGLKDGGIVCAESVAVPPFAFLTFDLQTNYADGV